MELWLARVVCAKAHIVAWRSWLDEYRVVVGPQEHNEQEETETAGDESCGQSAVRDPYGKRKRKLWEQTITYLCIPLLPAN